MTLREFCDARRQFTVDNVKPKMIKALYVDKYTYEMLQATVKDDWAKYPSGYSDDLNVHLMLHNRLHGCSNSGFVRGSDQPYIGVGQGGMLKIQMREDCVGVQFDVYSPEQFAEIDAERRKTFEGDDIN